MDDKTLIKVLKKVLKKDKKKKKKRQRKTITRKPKYTIEDPTTRGAFPIPGKYGGAYGQPGQPFRQPYGYTPYYGSGTTIVAQDKPLEITKKPPVKLVGNLEPEEERQLKESVIDLTKQQQTFKLLQDARNKQMTDIYAQEQKRKEEEDYYKEALGGGVRLDTTETKRKKPLIEEVYQIVKNPETGDNVELSWEEYQDEDLVMPPVAEQKTEILKPEKKGSNILDYLIKTDEKKLNEGDKVKVKVIKKKEEIKEGDKVKVKKKGRQPKKNITIITEDEDKNI